MLPVYTQCLDRSISALIETLKHLQWSWLKVHLSHICTLYVPFCICDKQRRSWSISVPGANNRLLCSASVMSLWHVSKHNTKKNDTTEMKNVNTKCKTESDIRIFKDWLSTVGEYRNHEYIGVEEMYMHLAGFFFSTHEIQRWLRAWFREMYPSFHQ